MSSEHRKAQIVTLCHYDNKLQVLLLQTKEDRGEYWQNITGSIDEGESWEQGAARELLEESGIEEAVNITDLTFSFHDRWKRDVLEKVFYCIAAERPSIQICPKEHQAYKWVNADEITEAHYGHISNYQAFQEVMKCIE